MKLSKELRAAAKVALEGDDEWQFAISGRRWGEFTAMEGDLALWVHEDRPEESCLALLLLAEIAEDEGR